MQFISTVKRRTRDAPAGRAFIVKNEINKVKRNVSFDNALSLDDHICSLRGGGHGLFVFRRNTVGRRELPGRTFRQQRRDSLDRLSRGVSGRCANRLAADRGWQRRGV